MHHVGKRNINRCRPIIAIFVCREVRLKKSRVYTDAYITEDYARAIQKEREILIKGTMKARNEHNLPEAKVKVTSTANDLISKMYLSILSNQFSQLIYMYFSSQTR